MQESAPLLAAGNVLQNAAKSWIRVMVIDSDSAFVRFATTSSGMIKRTKAVVKYFGIALVSGAAACADSEARQDSNRAMIEILMVFPGFRIVQVPG